MAQAPPDEDTPGESPLDVAGWLTRHGDALLHYALVMVKNEEQAKDLVQETLLAAWKGRHGYQGRASEKTWLTAILKNKIADHFRASAREALASGPFDPDALEAEDEESWREDGHHAVPPGAWGDPEASLERARFWEAVQACLDGLAELQRSAFVLREVYGIEGEMICKDLGITASNLWVLLHRARHRLRQCLEKGWFESARRNQDP
ncbi:MAG: sigma-70 family RNA polymerase sigma factor [Pseudomonadota bacterium]